MMTEKKLCITSVLYIVEVTIFYSKVINFLNATQQILCLWDIVYHLIFMVRYNVVKIQKCKLCTQLNIEV